MGKMGMLFGKGLRISGAGWMLNCGNCWKVDWWSRVSWVSWLK